MLSPRQIDHYRDTGWLVVEDIDQHEAELLQARDLVLYCA